jgi:hypothetical protein
MKLLYQISEWHALAKLRMHTEDSLTLMEESTKDLGNLLRQFRTLTCSQFSTVELPREADARVRRRKDATDVQHSNAVPTSVPPATMANGNAGHDQNSHGDDNTLSENQVPTSKSSA